MFSRNTFLERKHRAKTCTSKKIHNLWEKCVASNTSWASVVDNGLNNFFKRDMWSAVGRIS